MSTLTITTFSPQMHWPYGGSTAKLRLQYSALFVDSDNEVVIRGLFKDVDCVVASGILTVPNFTLITTNDALVNRLALCSGRFYDSTNAPRDWLFQNFVIPQLLTPSSNFGSLVTYNQGQTLDLPPSFYLDRDQTTALILSLLARLGITNARQGVIGLTSLDVDPVDLALPIAVGSNSPLIGNATKIQGIDVSSAGPADQNVLGFNALSGDIEWLSGIPEPPPTQRVVDSADSALTSDQVVFLDPTLGTFQFDLLDTATRTTELTIKNIATNAVFATVAALAGQTVDGNPTLILPAGSSITILPPTGSTNWEIVG